MFEPLMSLQCSGQCNTITFVSLTKCCKYSEAVGLMVQNYILNWVYSIHLTFLSCNTRLHFCCLFWLHGYKIAVVSMWLGAAFYTIMWMILTARIWHHY